MQENLRAQTVITELIQVFQQSKHPRSCLFTLRCYA